MVGIICPECERPLKSNLDERSNSVNFEIDLANETRKSGRSVDEIRQEWATTYFCMAPWRTEDISRTILLFYDRFNVDGTITYRLVDEKLINICPSSYHLTPPLYLPKIKALLENPSVKRIIQSKNPYMAVLEEIIQSPQP